VTSRPSILFISHEASRTGAPFVLLHLQRWIKANTGFKLTTLLRRGGPLLSEFAKLGETIVLESSHPGRPRWIRGIARRYRLDRMRLWLSFRALRNRPFKLVYSNTVTNGDLLTEVTQPSTPVITHVHELAYWFERSGWENWEAVQRSTTHFVAASEAVSGNLVKRYQIPASQISVVHEFIPAKEYRMQIDMAQRHKIRCELGIPSNAFVVGGSGMETWRKGKDLFVQLAAQICRRHLARPFHFVWVGWTGNEDDQRRLSHDIKAAGLTNLVSWTGEVSNPLDYFSSFDAFALVSREDPFPLVCLEAALLGIPVLCFAKAGGIPEFLETDSGFVVDYLDVGAMADKLQLLADDEALRRRLGSCGADKVRARFSVEGAAPRLLDIMKRLSPSLCQSTHMNMV
jgi:glycosyltransferase involved in cell wall biosynthesis